MRITVSELPHERAALEEAWTLLRAHTRERQPDVVVLPEFAFVEPVWVREAFDQRVWDIQVATCDAWLERLRFGLNICTELWAVEAYGHYAATSVSAIISPRATAAATVEKWLAIGKVAAVRSGAFSISSNRVHSDGSCGGVGWVIDPDGQILALTSANSPFVTVDIDPAAAERARATYPRYVFADA